MVKKFKPLNMGVSPMKANIELVKKNQKQKYDEVLLHEPNNRDHYLKNPDEFTDVKDFANKAKAVNKHPPEFFFDMVGDNKPLAKKKKSRLEKLKQPFTIVKGKKIYKEYHKL